MKIKQCVTKTTLLGAAAATLVTLGMVGCGSANGQVAPTSATLGANQTLGYSSGGLDTFTYTQSFDCVDQPLDDLDFNSVLAQSDPAEMQTPVCQAAIQPTIDPSGISINTSAPVDPTGTKIDSTAILYVLVPMFPSPTPDMTASDAITCAPASTSSTPPTSTLFRPGTLCGTALGNTLITLFGSIPEAYQEKPTVYTQCPTPGEVAGTCTMHTATIDLSKALAALGKITSPATGNIFVPSPNHSHVIGQNLANTPAIWWEVEPVLVTNAADWPNEGGTSGITSVTAMQAAEKAGTAVQVPSNFFLFFGSKSNT